MPIYSDSNASSSSSEEEEEEELIIPISPRRRQQALSAAQKPELIGGKMVDFGGGRRKVLVPFRFANKTFVVSSPSSSASQSNTVARVEQCFQHFEPQFCQLLTNKDKDDFMVSACASRDGSGSFCVAWESGVVVVYSAQTCEQSSSLLDFTKPQQWQVDRELFPREPSKLCDMAMSPSLLVLCFERSLQVWNIQLAELVFASLDYAGHQASFSPDGRMFATLSHGSNNIRVWYRNKNSNDHLSFLNLPNNNNEVVKIGWRPSRANSANSLLVFSSTSAEIFQEADYAEDFGFYQLYRLDLLAQPLMFAGWINVEGEEENARFIGRGAAGRKKLDAKWAEMDMPRPHPLLLSSLKSSKCEDSILLLTRHQYKTYLLRGLGQSPRVAVHCILDKHHSELACEAIVEAVECAMCFSLQPRGNSVLCLLQTNTGVLYLQDLTLPYTLMDSGKKIGLHQDHVVYAQFARGFGVFQDASSRVVVRKANAVVWQSAKHDGQVFASAVSPNGNYVAISTKSTVNVVCVDKKEVAMHAPRGDSLVDIAILNNGSVVCLYPHAYVVMSSQQQQQQDDEVSIAGAQATCIAAASREAIWIGTSSGAIYFGGDLYFDAPCTDACVEKIQCAGVWMAALLSSGKCLVGSLGEKYMHELALPFSSSSGSNVLDFALCETTPNTYFILVLREGGLVNVCCPVEHHQHHHNQAWHSMFEHTIPTLQHIAWFGAKFLAFSSLDWFWELSGETTALQHFTEMCLQPELPEYHPRMLMELFRLGDVTRVEAVLRHVNKCLKEAPPGRGEVTIPVLGDASSAADDKNEAIVEEVSTSASFTMWSTSPVPMMSATNTHAEDWLAELEDMLPTRRIAGINANELLHVLNICNLLRKFTKTQNYKALDTAGARFALAVETARLNKHKLKTSEAIWALHSNTQANLIQLFASTPTADWQEDLQSIGAGYWIENFADCQALFERLAKAAHVRNPKDPFHSLLYYSTLGKPRVSSALFKLAGKPKLATLLAMDFSKPENAMISIKNAYACMEKKMFKEAAAFFVLGGRVNEALRVLARNLGDCQLALLVGRILQAKQSMEMILKEFTWEIGLAMKDPFLCAICTTLLDRGNTQSIVACFQSQPAMKQNAEWFIDYAHRHEAIQVGHADPLMSVLLLQHLKSENKLVDAACGAYYLRERMPMLAKRFTSFYEEAPTVVATLPKSDAIEALYFGKPLFQVESNAALSSAVLVGEEIIRALFQQDFSALARLLFNKQFPVLSTQQQAKPATWIDAFCSSVLVVLVLEHVLEEVEHGSFARAVWQAITAGIGAIQRLPFPELPLPELVSVLVEYKFQGNAVAKQCVWEHIDGPKEMQRFVLALCVKHRRHTLANGASLEQWNKQTLVSYTLYSKPGMGLSSLGLLGEDDSVLLLASSRQGLREVNIHSSLAFRQRTADGRGLVDAERDSFPAVQSRFHFQERNTVETWEENLLARLLLGKKAFQPVLQADTTAPPNNNVAVRGDRDVSVVSKLAIHAPSRVRYVACGQDGTARLWALGKEKPEAVLKNFSVHPLTLVDYNPAGSLLLAVDTTGSCALYDETCHESFFHTMPYKPSCVTDSAFLSNTVFATTNTEGKVSVFDSLLPPKSCMVASWHHPRGFEDKKQPASSTTSSAQPSSSMLTRVVYSSRLECLITGSSRGLLFAVDMRKCIAIQNCTVSTKPVTALALASNGMTIACGTADGSMHMWPMFSGDLLACPTKTLPLLHVGGSSAAANKHAFFKSSSQMQFTTTATVGAHSAMGANAVSDLAFSQDGSLFSCGSDGTAKVTFTG